MPPRNIAPRRSLNELYRQGVAVRFDAAGPHMGPFLDPIPADKADEIIEVWVGPPNPLQRDEAMRAAQAARASSMLRVKRDKESEEYLTSMNFIADMSTETLVDYLMLTTQEDRKAEAIRDVLAEDEWKDFTSLQDAMRLFEEEGTPEDDPDFAALLQRDEEYGQQVNARFMQITEAARDLMSRQPRPKLEDQGLEKRGMLVGSERFMESYELWMTYFSVRDPENHDELWFSSPKELREQDDIIQGGIKDALNIFINDAAEAKNSQGVADGSSSSPLPNAPETSDPSTPQAVSA